MIRTCLIVLFGLACAACASSTGRVTSIREVPTPLIATCHPSIAAAEPFPDSDEALRAAPNLFGRVRLLVAGRLLRIARQRELEAALRACMAPGLGPSGPLDR
jgi:hypothetical protein